MKLSNIIVLLGALGIGAYMYIKYRVPPKIDFPELNTTDLYLNPVDINQYYGRNIFITMWAPWCADCRAEMPSIQQLKDALPQEDWVFLAISGYDLEKEKKYMLEYPFDLIYLHMDQKLEDVGIHSIPTNYILNRSGEVVYQKVGGENWGTEVMIKKVEDLVAQ